MPICRRFYPSPPIRPPASKLSEMIAIPEIDIGQRNTPALFGASVIDAIPDAAILANERNQRLKRGLSVLNGEEVPAGRAAKLSRKRVGKFGWKANIGNLSEFVRVACANELGLGNPLQAQPASLSQPEYRPRGLDLTDQQCDLMTALSLAAAALGSDPRICGRGRPRRRRQKALQADRLHQLPHSRFGRGSRDLQRFLLHEMGEGLGGGGFYGESAAGLRRWLDVPERMAHAAAVGCCRFRSLSSRRPSSDPGRGHQAARRSGSRRLRIASRVSPTSSKKT